MPDHTNVYKNEADRYDLLISKQPNLAKVIEEIRAFEGLDIIDMGAGTGRFTALLAPKAKSIVAIDSSESMLGITAKKLQDAGLANYQSHVADHRNLPIRDQSADLVVAGWSICYLGSTNVQNWKENIKKVMKEIMRILRPGGSIIIFETMGTGTHTPNPPDYLKNYYSLLENEFGFSYKWIRMDYEFENIQEAEELSRFFFGDELADKVVKQNLIHLPECAGIWWLHMR
jgi:ubiquinone/menaquinone biosynthesis C-methylase UbiE